MKKSIIDECKKIKTAKGEVFWDADIPQRNLYDFSDSFSYEKYKDACYDCILNRRMLYEIVKRAKEEGFDISKYELFEMPEPNLFYFYNNEEDLWICFGVYLDAPNKNERAIPFSCDTGNLEECKKCSDAVWEE